ncbi:hypothetical protein N2U02_004494 [Salmonella enterica]|nr:hypothetical protein [Salmonella enterica]
MFEFLIFIIAAVLIYFMYNSFSQMNKNAVKYYVRNLVLLASLGAVALVGFGVFIAVMGDTGHNLAIGAFLAVVAWLCMFKQAYYWLNSRAALKVFSMALDIETVCAASKKNTAEKQQPCRVITDGDRFAIRLSEGSLLSGERVTIPDLRRNYMSASYMGGKDYTAVKMFNVKTRIMTFAAIEGETTIAAVVQF